MLIIPRRVSLSQKMWIIRIATCIPSPMRQLMRTGLGWEGSRTSSACGPYSGPWRLRAIGAVAALVSSWPRAGTPGALLGLGQGSPHHHHPEASQALARACSSCSQHLARPSQFWARAPRFEVTHVHRTFVKALHLAAYSSLSDGCGLLISQRPVSRLPRLLR